MLVLALETSTAQSSVCLTTDAGVLATTTLGAQRGRAHAEFLAPAIAFCLQRAGVGVADVTAIAVGLGPGLYTGMRVGIATAEAFAHARGLPAVGIVSLDLLAFPVRHARRLVCSAVDARRGELFWAFYRPSPGGVQQVTEHRVGAAGKLAGEVEALGEDVLCVGDGAVAHRGLLESAGAEVGAGATDHPTAQALAELALPRLRRGDGRPAAAGPGRHPRPPLRPVYLRRPDARINLPVPILASARRPDGEGDR